MKNSVFSGLVAVLLSASVPLSAEGSVSNVAAGESSVTDNNGEEVFATELSAVEDLLKKLARERKTTGARFAEYTVEDMECAGKFFEFAKKELLPHTAALTRSSRDPEGMIVSGQEMVKQAPHSWQGYDFIATGHFSKLNVDEAMKGFKKAIELAPDMQKDWYRYMLAACYRMKENQEEAYDIYERIIAAKKNWIAVKNSYLGASMLLLLRGDGRAADYFDKGIILSTPDERKALFATGVCGRFAGSNRVPLACAPAVGG